MMSLAPVIEVYADHGWLKSYHTFSFANYYDPKRLGFSDLRVINDDRVAPAKGFGLHPHKDMEIFTYVLEGALAHKDSMGNGEVIRPGDVQIMSAGTGVYHSEFNESSVDPVHLLQIWIVPNVASTEPGYQQRYFDAAQKRGRLALILSPDGEGDSLSIRQDARVYAGLFDGAETATQTLAAGRYAYVHVASGSVGVNGKPLTAGDGLALREPGSVVFANGADAEVLLFDLAGHELPVGPH